MSLPVTTTTLTVTRVPVDPTRDGYDTPPAAVTVVTGLPAVVSGPSGRAVYAGGDRAVIDAGFRSEPADVRPGDTVMDETTGETYRVVWAQTRSALGLDHTLGDLVNVTGAAP